MKNNIQVICIFFLLTNTCFAQTTPNDYHILFYNLENLFDIRNNPATTDEEFTPEGARHWTYNRFKKKIANLAKVILNASEWIPPDLIAVCEAENRYVLERLSKNTPLAKYNYRIIHKESPDPRGIDVALLYNKNTFYPLEYDYFPLTDDKDNTIKSREILYVNGILGNTDTIHIFVNHWPSRYSGLLETMDARKRAANRLLSLVRNIQRRFNQPKIIITGDFNDQPEDESLSINLKAQLPEKQPAENNLYNLSFQWMKDDIQTIKHQSQWNVFDQFIVSGSLLNNRNKVYTCPEFAHIIKLPFLVVKDDRYGNVKLNRTYNGYKYNGGFSDHLPVLLKLRADL